MTSLLLEILTFKIFINLCTFSATNRVIICTELITVADAVQVGSPRRQLPLSAADVDRSAMPSSSAAGTLPPDKKQKWPSIFHKHKSKVRCYRLMQFLVFSYTVMQL